MFASTNYHIPSNLCLDRFGSMVVIEFMTLFSLVAFYYNFWIDLLHSLDFVLFMHNFIPLMHSTLKLLVEFHNFCFL
jgi:hypothetical protein